LRNNDEIKFLLSGEGVGWTKLKQMQAASPLPNVTLIERVPESELETSFRWRHLVFLPQEQYGCRFRAGYTILLAIGRR